MRTSLNIPDELLREAKKLSNTQTVTQTILVALHEYIQRQKVKQLMELKGSLADSYDYKKLRKKR